MKGKIKCSGEEVDKVTHWMILVANYKLNPVPGTQKQKISWVKQRHCISMAMAFETTHFLLSRPTASTSTLFLLSSNLTRPKPASLPSRFFHCRSKRLVLTPRFAVKACAVNVQEKNVAAKSGEWGKACSATAKSLLEEPGLIFSPRWASKSPSTINVELRWASMSWIN